MLYSFIEIARIEADTGRPAVKDGEKSIPPEVNSVAVDQAGAHVATAGSDGVVRLFRLSSFLPGSAQLDPLAKLHNHDSILNRVCFDDYAGQVRGIFPLSVW